MNTNSTQSASLVATQIDEKGFTNKKDFFSQKELVAFEPV